jgi:hypothetical protein
MDNDPERLPQRTNWYIGDMYRHPGDVPRGRWPPYGWQARRSFVVGPLVAGLVILVCGTWAYEYSNRVNTEPGRIITTTAVVDSIQRSLIQYGGCYAAVHYRAQQTLVRTSLSVPCQWLYGTIHRPGGLVTIAYAPGNAYVFLASEKRVNRAWVILALSLAFGIGALVVAAVNLFLGP